MRSPKQAPQENKWRKIHGNLPFTKEESPDYPEESRWRRQFHRLKTAGIGYGRFLAWFYCIIDLTIGLYSFIDSWMIEPYSGMILTEDFDENAWGFGQLVAIILISLPFLTALEEYKGISLTNPHA